MLTKLKKLYTFLTYDIWRITHQKDSSKRIGAYNVIKTFILAFRNVKGYQLNTRASALTYSSLLSIIPLLAVLFAIAKGFGFQNIVQSELFRYFGGQKEIMENAVSFIDQSLEYAKTGVFLGVGVVLLFYTVVNLLSAIEKNFNDIWRVKKGRSIYRMFTDYFALFLVAPIFLIVNAGLSLFLHSVSKSSEVIGFVANPLLEATPYLITIFLFTFLFIYIPNTKVKFSAALFGGVFSGIFFQIFQYFYINGQIYISKYNAIYGSFAALPLLLLWLQMSWFICLFGVMLTFSFQNVHKFSFENESKNISRRYKDFVLLLISTLIIKRFEKGETPYTADELSQEHKIPTQLTNDALYILEKTGIIVEIPTSKNLTSAYIPAMDIHKITAHFLFEKIAVYGSEDFIIDKENQFKNEWSLILNLQKAIQEKGETVMLMDL